MTPQELNARRRLAEIGIFAVLLGGALVALPGLGDLRERLAGATRRWWRLPPRSRSDRASRLSPHSRASSRGGFPGASPTRWRWPSRRPTSCSPTGGAGGLALGAWALRRTGMPADRIGRRTVAFFLITSSINFAAVDPRRAGARNRRPVGRPRRRDRARRAPCWRRCSSPAAAAPAPGRQADAAPGDGSACDRHGPWLPGPTGSATPSGCSAPAGR